MTCVKVRLSGDAPAIAEALRVLHIAALAEGFEIPEKSGLYPNRREPGYRVYVTLRSAPSIRPNRAGRHTAAKQSAAPLPPPRSKSQERGTTHDDPQTAGRRTDGPS